MKRPVHNLMEAKALTLEAIQNGSGFELDGITYVSHDGAHIADVIIEASGMIVLRCYPIEGQTDFKEVGRVY